MLGTGETTGGLILMRLLDYSSKAQEWDLGLLSAFIIDMVSEVDPAVSPFLDESSSIYIRYNNGTKKVEMGPIREEAFKKYKNRVKVAREAFKKLWLAINEKEGEEDAILRKLEELIKSN
jgi:hypothetical protein